MSTSSNQRLVSLDVFRGAVMFLLLAEHADLYYLFTFVAPDNPVFSMLVNHFFHHEWHGMHFWDLIQPYFTYVIGVAMVFSLKKRQQEGESWMQTFRHIIFRCAILFFLGIIIRSVAQRKIVWDLWNILTLLSVNIFITFLIFRFRDSTKLAVSFGLLLLTELLYRFFMVNGFDQPFVKGHNLGSFIDMLLMGKTHPDGWVFINCLPTTAHAIWGLLTGNLLLSQRNAIDKFKILVTAGLAAIAIGQGMDLLNVSPINKHLSTIAFMIVSGGWCVITYSFLYWLVDIRGHKKWTVFFIAIGMNPIFIYVFSRTVGKMWFNGFIAQVIRGIMSLTGFSQGIVNLTAYMTILGLEWCLCYWLYKKRIFIKI